MGNNNLIKPAVVILSLFLVSISAMAAHASGAVYAMTNADDNEIVIYDRAVDGRLTLRGSIETGGSGSAGMPGIVPADALGAQAPLLLSRNQRWLFAVNAGSNQISVFRVHKRGLTLVETVGSGGNFPASLSLYDRWLYVLNSGGVGNVENSNITGFTVGDGGHLTPIPESTRSVGPENNPQLPFFLQSPAQVGFSPRGDFLVVTIKGTNEIRVFPVDENGVPAETAVTTMSNGLAPFGFTFDRHAHLIVVEPFGTGSIGEMMAGAVSSYDLEEDGTLNLISPSVPNSQTATCWITPNGKGRFAYATNNGNNTISGYRVGRCGELTLLTADGVSAYTGANPVDLAATPDGRFLYNVNAGSGTVGMYRVKKATGALVFLGEIGGLPDVGGAVGIVAR